MTLARLVLGLCLLGPHPAQDAPRLYIIVVSGLSGEPEYARRFGELGRQVVDAAKQRWGVADSGLVYLAENPAADPTRITGRATLAAIQTSVHDVARRARRGDIVMIMLFGHGGGDGTEARLNLPGPDLSAADLELALGAFQGVNVVVVNTASGSGGFLKPLSGPERVIVTATKSAMERNATKFPEFFVRGLISGEADTDKDGRLSILEAFGYAKREVGRAYETGNMLQTEHAQLDDSLLARRLSLSLTREVASTDPTVAALQVERRELETQIGVLRAKKAAMDSTAYSRELERLLVKLAETTRAIRAHADPEKP
ncbi:MAG: hypothetical protein ABI647_18515 [Gemmatimonadota bacterium]